MVSALLPEIPHMHAWPCGTHACKCKIQYTQLRPLPVKFVVEIVLEYCKVEEDPDL